MMTYQNAELEIVKFSAEDVLATSTGCQGVVITLPEETFEE